MRAFDVAPPDPVEAPETLGRLGAALRRLASQQGAWPPAAPRQVTRVPPDPARTAGLDAPAALEAGAAAADRLVDAGTDLVVVPGGGPSAPALVLLAALLDRDPVSVVGTDPSPDWAQRVTTVRDGLRAARPHLGDPPALLASVGAVEVAELAGLLLQCAVRRTPVLLSGAPDAWAAAVVAQRVAPAVGGWLHAGVSPDRPVVALAVGELLLRPLLDLGLDAPEGADLALGVLTGGVGLARG